MSQSDPSQKKNFLETLLGIFTEVRGGEGRTVLLLTLNIFLILTAYYIIKPVREALILGVPRGDELKSYASAGQAILLLGAVPLYAWIASRVPRRRLINSVTIFFASNLVLFFLAIKNLPAAEILPTGEVASATGTVILGVGFFLWVGIFNLMVPAQFWSFANDIYSSEQGKRLFAIVAFGASLGAVMGSGITDRLIEPLGVDQLLLVSGGILLVSLLITNAVDSQQKQSPVPAAVKEDEEPLSKDGSFQLVFRNRYLLYIALLMLVLNWINTTGEFILGRFVKETVEASAIAQGIPEGERGDWVGTQIGGFYASFFFVVNIIGLSVQLFLVSRILKYLGVRVALLILPFIALGGYALIGFASVGLSVVRWAKTAENATDYSLQNTVRQALFLPTTREEKYKAKQAIDTFFVRAGDVLSALLVYLGINQLALSTAGFARVNLVLAVVWIVLAVAIGIRHKQLTANDE